MFQSDISDKKWIIYDIFGNLGWILYFVAYGITIINRISFSSISETVFFATESIAVILILIGIIELINERIHKLDRLLPKIRLYRGFGALFAAGCIGAVFGVLKICILYLEIASVLFTAGGLLCGIFSFLLLIKYKKV